MTSGSFNKFDLTLSQAGVATLVSVSIKESITCRISLSSIVLLDIDLSSKFWSTLPRYEFYYGSSPALYYKDLQPILMLAVLYVQGKVYLCRREHWRHL